MRFLIKKTEFLIFKGVGLLPDGDPQGGSPPRLGFDNSCTGGVRGRGEYRWIIDWPAMFRACRVAGGGPKFLGRGAGKIFFDY